MRQPCKHLQAEDISPQAQAEELKTESSALTTPGAGVRVAGPEAQKNLLKRGCYKESERLTKRTCNTDNPNTRVGTESGEDGWGNFESWNLLELGSEGGTGVSKPKSDMSFLASFFYLPIPSFLLSLPSEAGSPETRYVDQTGFGTSARLLPLPPDC